MWSGRCIQKQIWPKLCWTRRLGGLRCVRHTFPKAQIHTTPACPDFKYGWFHGVEKLDRYERGGYHPVAIDEVLHDRYRIVDKLGHGGYSTVWLAHDSQHDHLVAVKIGISGSSSTGGESSTLYKLSRSPLRNTHGAEFVPTLLDSFSVQGPNGVHMCLVMDITDGDLHTAKSNRLFPISVARALAAKLALATQAIHSYGIIHGDIRLSNVYTRRDDKLADSSAAQFRKLYGEPETFAIQAKDGSALPENVPRWAVEPVYLGKRAGDYTIDDARRLVLGDFGEAFYPLPEKRLGRECHTPIASRAPEAFFEPTSQLSYPSDVWSLGTAIWEILGMKFIFSREEGAVDEIVAEQIDVLGYADFPQTWRQMWERTCTDDEHTETIPRRPTEERETWPPLEEAFEEFIHKYRRQREHMGLFGEEEIEAILKLMRGMLRFRPEDRLTIDDVVRSEWMVKWALPELER